MTEKADLNHCPYCGAQMEARTVHLGSGNSWLDSEPKGLRRIMWMYFGSQAPAFEEDRQKHAASSQDALSCPKCGTMVIPGPDCQSGMQNNASLPTDDGMLVVSDSDSQNPFQNK